MWGPLFLKNRWNFVKLSQIICCDVIYGRPLSLKSVIKGYLSIFQSIVGTRLDAVVLKVGGRHVGGVVVPLNPEHVLKDVDGFNRGLDSSSRKWWRHYCQIWKKNKKYLFLENYAFTRAFANTSFEAFWSLIDLSKKKTFNICIGFLFPYFLLFEYIWHFFWLKSSITTLIVNDNIIHLNFWWKVTTI